MRLNDLPDASPDAPDRESREGDHPFIQGPGLWGPFYGALWLNAALLAALIVAARHGSSWGLAAILGWAVFLGLTAFVACNSRISIHDMLVGLDPRERLLLDLMIVLLFFLPLFLGEHVFPEGFLWSAPATLLFAVRPSHARRHLAWMLLGAWFAAWRAPQPGLPWLLLAFGVSWLLALAATHFAFTGDPHGLAGWWPIRQALRAALAVALPALAVALAAWWLWPRPKVRILLPGDPHPAPSLRLVDQLDPLVLAELFWRGIMALVCTVVLFAILLYIRRILLKRGRLQVGVDVLPGQVARLEFQAAPPERRAPGLAGRRGQIVKLWGRWAAALAREGLARREGETAAEYSRRLAAENPELTPPPAMTELLEKAHYSPDEPLPADLQAMRQQVEDELSRLSLQRQKPIEPE